MQKNKNLKTRDRKGNSSNSYCDIMPTNVSLYRNILNCGRQYTGT